MLNSNVFLNEITYIKIIKYISLIYILSLSVHFWNINFSGYILRVSEIIFIILLFIYFIGLIKKKIKISIIKSDIIFSFFLLSNLILMWVNNFNHNSLLGFTISIYLFLIYFLYRNIFNYIDVNNFLKITIYLSIISGILGIVGWILLQIDVSNILAEKRDYPFSIGKQIRAEGLLGGPNLLAFVLIIGLNILLSTKVKNRKYFYLKLIILNSALILTFSKSIVLYFICLILIYYIKIASSKLKYMCFVVILLLAIFHSFFTSFFLLNKSKNYEWLNDSYTPLHLKPLYEDNNYILYATRYTFLKIKSAEIISNDYLWGIGYENFKKSKIKEYPFLEGTKPHSTYLGILSEFGIFGFISIIIILLYSFRISLDENNFKKNNLSIIIVYFILEGIHTDIITLKIIWIIFAITISLSKNKIYHSTHN